jgi:hypothetical protein
MLSCGVLSGTVPSCTVLSGSEGVTRLATLLAMRVESAVYLEAIRM